MWNREGRAVADGRAEFALALTHQRETFACLDEHGRAVRPAIVWMDVRERRDWSDDVLARIGLTRERVPALSPPGVRA